MVEQGTHKPLVGSSTLPPGTKRARRLRRLEPIVRRAFHGRARLARGSTLLVAVSGGADSVALLVTLASLAPELGVTLHAAHLHHGLRGRDADADLRHVRALCRALGEIRTFDPDARVVMLTSQGQAATVVQARRLGARDFLLKPCDSARLLASLDRALA